MSLFRRKPAQRPMISWPVDRPLGDIQSIPSPYPTLYSPIASSPSTDISFAHRWPLKDDIFESPITFSSPLKDDVFQSQVTFPSPSKDDVFQNQVTFPSPLREDVLESQVSFPSPLNTNEDVSIILDVYPPPPPPKDELPRHEVNDELAVRNDVVELPADGSEKERSVPERKDFKEVATRRSMPAPLICEDIDISTTRVDSPSLPVYQEEADIYRYLSRSPPMYKDDEDVYQDVYDNISPLRSTRSFSNGAIRHQSYSTAGIEPVSPLRLNKRKLEDDIYKEISPLHSHPAYDEDLLEDLPLISKSAYDEDDNDDLSPLPQALYSSYNSSPLSWHSNRTSDLTMSTVATTFSHRPSDDIFSNLSLRARSNKSCTDYDCDFDYEDYFEKIQHEIDISDAMPDNDRLGDAGKIPIFDSDGKGRPFSSIYSGETAIGEQQMVIFVRHFFCGACQAYLRALTKAIPFSTYFSLPKPTSITIIGLGSPELINSYRKRTNCPFPIYSDPTKRLYRALGMKWVLRPGKNPGYMSGMSSKAWVMSQVEEMNNIEEKLKYRGGHMLWVGGEFLFRDSEVVWCHRMKTYRGHAEIDVIKKVLDVED